SRRPFLLHAAQDGRLDFATYQRTQAAMITSRLVISAALADPRVSDLGVVQRHANPVAWLEKAIKADYSIAPELLSISLSGENPDELVLLVNAVREAYLKEIVNREQNELNTRLDRLKAVHKRSDERLRSRRTMLRELARTLVSQDPQTLARAHQLVLERIA